MFHRLRERIALVVAPWLCEPQPKSTFVVTYSPVPTYPSMSVTPYVYQHDNRWTSS